MTVRENLQNKIAGQRQQKAKEQELARNASIDFDRAFHQRLAAAAQLNIDAYLRDLATLSPKELDEKI